MKNLITILVVITLAWASLFIIIFHETGQLKQLLNQDTVILKAQHQTETDLQNKISDLQNHVDCLFNLATNPNHSNAFIANPNPCMISALPSPTDSPAKTSTPLTNTKNSNPVGQGSGTNSEQNSKPTPQPSPTPTTNLFQQLNHLTGGLL